MAKQDTVLPQDEQNNESNAGSILGEKLFLNDFAQGGISVNGDP